MRLFVRNRIDNCLCVAFLLLFWSGCQKQDNAVSGTIEMDEVHVGPRSGGRVGKIFAWEGTHLRAGQPIVELEASELRARRDLAEARSIPPFTTPTRSRPSSLFCVTTPNGSRICSSGK